MLNSKLEIRNSKWAAVIFGAILSLLIILVPMRAFAQFDPLEGACAENPSSAACTESKRGQDPAENPIADTVNNVANLIAIVAAVVSIIVIIVAGITMVLSSGEASSVKSARDAIIFASVGMVIVALARSIVVFIVNRI